MECFDYHKKEDFCSFRACKFSRHNTHRVKTDSETNTTTDNKSSDSDCVHAINHIHHNPRKPTNHVSTVYHISKGAQIHRISKKPKISERHYYHGK